MKRLIREVALKMLFQEASQKRHLAGLFEREFHITLIQTRAQNRTVDTFGFDTQTQESGEEKSDCSREVEQNQVSRLPLVQSERYIDDLQLRPKIQQALLDLFLKVSQKCRLSKSLALLC